MTEDIRFGTSDLIPRLQYNGIVAKLLSWLPFNWSIEKILREGLTSANRQDLGLSEANITLEQLYQCISDLKGAGLLPNAQVWGAELPEAIQRASPLGSIGTSESNIWFESEQYASGKTFWFYVDGNLRLIVESENNIALSRLGIVGSKIQICEVSSEGIVGWWTDVAMPGGTVSAPQSFLSQLGAKLGTW